MNRYGNVYVLALLMKIYMKKTKEKMKREEWGQHAVIFAQARLVLVLQDGNSLFGPASCI